MTMRKDRLPQLPLHLKPTKSDQSPLRRPNIHLPPLPGDRNLAIVNQGLRVRYAPPKRVTWDAVIMKARNDFAYENYLLCHRMRCMDKALRTFRGRIADDCRQFRDTGVIHLSHDDTRTPRRRKPRKLPPFK